MRTFSAQEAAVLLHLNVKRVQSLARTGKLPAVRVGRKWLFPSDEIERMLGKEVATLAPATTAGAFAISARNRLRGRIVNLVFDGLMAEILVRIGDQELVSVITRSSADRLGLELGDEVFAVVKATEVILGKEGREA